MSVSKEELQALVNDICPHCAAGFEVRQRDDTKEWVHDQPGHTICWASRLRNNPRFTGTENG